MCVCGVRMESRALHFLGQCSATELPLTVAFFIASSLSTVWKAQYPRCKNLYFTLNCQSILVIFLREISSC